MDTIDRTHSGHFQQAALTLAPADVFAELAAVKAECDHLRHERDTLTKIINTAKWTPVERVVMAATVTKARPIDDRAAWRAIEAPIKELAAQIGISDKTTGETLTKLHEAGVIDRRTERTPTNRYGQEIPKHSANLNNGDRWQVHTVIAIPDVLPDELPELSRSSNQSRTQVVNETKRREFAELRTKLDNLLAGATCPHCGEAGHLHGEISATCGACGTHLDQTDLAYLIDGQEIPTPTETEIISTPAKPAADRRRALRNLAGVDTPPPPSVDYDHFNDDGITVTEIISTPDEAPENREIPEAEIISIPESAPAEPAEWKELPHIFSEAEIISTPDEALRNEPAPVLYDVLQDVATVEYLSALGARFALAEMRSKKYVNPMSDDGMSELNYLDAPMSEAAALTHLKQGGNVGILTEHSAGLIVIDIDAGAPAFIREYGRLAMGARISRQNAPDRVKLLALCPDAGDSFKLESEDRTRVIEVISTRKAAIIAGTHETGAPILCEVAYELPLISWAELSAIAQAWSGVELKQARRHSPLSAQMLPTTQTTGTVQTKIIEWQQAHEDECLEMLGNPTEGAYIALRTERTPSARVTRHNGRIVLIDYGASNQHIDLFDVFIDRHGIDKRVAVGRLMNDRDVLTGVKLA